MSPSFVDGEDIDLFWRNSKVAEGKLYPSWKVLHCDKIRSDCFVVSVQNFINGEVPLSCPNEEPNTLEETHCGISFISWSSV